MSRSALGNANIISLPEVNTCQKDVRSIREFKKRHSAISMIKGSNTEESQVGLSPRVDLNIATAVMWRLLCLYKDMQVITLHSIAVTYLGFC